MKYKKKLLAASILISSFGIALVGFDSQAQAGPDDRITNLERLIRLQQKKLEDQQRRLERQQKKIGRQEQRLRELEKKRSTGSASKKDSAKPDTPSWLATIPWYELGKLRGGFAATGPLTVVLPDGRILAFPTGGPSDPLLAQDVAPKPPVVLPPDQPKKPRRRRTTKRKATPPPAKKPPQTPPATTTQPPAKSTPAASRPKSEKQPDQISIATGTILLRPGTLQIEPGIEYQRFSVSSIAIAGLSIFDAIVIGTVRVDRIDRDIVTGSVRARYGITSRVQADLYLPFVYSSQQQVFGFGTNDATVSSFDGYGIGDIEAGVTWQALLGRRARPSILLRAFGRFPSGRDPFGIPTVVDQNNRQRLTKTPTGNGFYGVGFTANFVWTIDPVAFFAGGGYTFNLERNVGGGFGTINPGDQYNFFAGMNIALNDKVSMNISFINQHTRTTRQNDNALPGSSFNDARLVAGASIALGKSWSLLVSAAAGLTDQAPDFAFTISVPITFNTTPITFAGLNQ